MTRRHSRLLQSPIRWRSWARISARRRQRRLLLDRAARADAERAGRLSTCSIACKPRLTVGAANVRTSQMRYFDSRDMPLGVEHVMASGALPPAFPAVRIDGELYWDGGILSNTPVEAVFDDNPRRNSLIFAVHIWNPIGPEPEHDLGGAEPPEGHPVFQPRRQPHRAPEADPPAAPCDHRAGRSACPRLSATAKRCGSWPAMAA